MTAAHWQGPFPAPAKLNLFLHVVGRRPDGYHLLQTVFRFVDYADELWFRLRDDSLIRRDSYLPNVPEDSDLCLRAARLLAQEAGIATGADIRLEKRLPLGGGLGGGSSDAATVLLVLNRLWGINWPRERLQELGLRLGADVPVFVFGENAFAEGVGELLAPVAVPDAWYVILVPPVSVSTPDVFRDEALTRNTPLVIMRDFPTAAGHNDLEPVVRRNHPPVAQCLDWLSQFGDARMSGSGASCFAAFPSREDAEKVFAQRPAGIGGFVAEGLPRHPLVDY